MRRSWPSICGLRPRPASRIALSTALTRPLSHTCTVSMRGFGRRDGADLVDRHRVAIGLDRHRIEQRGAGPAGPQTGEFALQRGDGALHAAVHVFLVVCVGHGHSPRSRAKCLTRRRSASLFFDDRARPSPRSTAASAPLSWMREDDDRNAVLARQRDGRGIHHLKIPRQHLVIAQDCRSARRRVPSWGRRYRRRRPGCALSMASQFISAARSAAAVSVVKKGLPVPAAKITTRPFSMWRMARRRI